MRRRAAILLLSGLTAVAAFAAEDPIVAAEARLAAKDFAGAQKILEELLHQDPANARAHGNLALLLRARGKTKEAVDEGRLAAAFAPETAQARYIYGLTLLDAGRPAEAAREIEKAAALNPGEASILRALAAAHSAAGDARAASAWQSLINLEPKETSYRAALAELFWRAGETAKGNRVMEESLLALPYDGGLSLAYGRALVEQERFVDGAARLETARGAGAGGPSLDLLLGDAYRQAGDADAALRAFERAAIANPGSADARAQLGRSLVLAGAADRALPELEQAARLDPKSAAIQLDLGRALETAGRRPEAEQAYRAAVRLAPGLARAHYALGRLLAREGRMAEAQVELAAHKSIYERGLKKVSELDMREGEISFAWAELHQGRVESALTLFTALPESPETLLGTAQALSRLNRHGDAVRALEKARRMDPDDRRVELLLSSERSRAEAKP